MLKLTVYGSSSKGNSYVLENNDTKIMLDCGVKNINNKVDFNSINAILLTHQHMDHIGGIKNIKDYYKGKYYGNKQTIDILPVIDKQKEEIIEGEPFEIGTFRIVGFSVYHDVPNIGFLIRSLKSGAKILYITDSSSVSNIHFKDIDYIIIEANHSYEWLEEKEEIDFKDYRNYGEYGHMAVEDTIEFLNENINVNTKKIILCHISSKCENYLEMKEKVEKGINNPNIEVMALNPHETKSIEIILKKDIDIEF